jgi:hypothetical protein
MPTVLQAHTNRLLLGVCNRLYVGTYLRVCYSSSFLESHLQTFTVEMYETEQAGYEHLHNLDWPTT